MLHLHYHVFSSFGCASDYFVWNRRRWLWVRAKYIADCVTESQCAPAKTSRVARRRDNVALYYYSVIAESVKYIFCGVVVHARTYCSGIVETRTLIESPPRRGAIFFWFSERAADTYFNKLVINGHAGGITVLHYAPHPNLGHPYNVRYFRETVGPPRTGS